MVVVLEFLTLQDKHNIRTMSIYIKFICSHWKTGQKSSPEVHFSISFCFQQCKNRRDRMVVGYTLPVQSVPITTNVVGSNPVHGEVLNTTLCDKVCQ